MSSSAPDLVKMASTSFAPGIVEFGFARSPGSKTVWQRRTRDGLVVFELRKASNRVWMPVVGGGLLVSVDLVDDHPKQRSANSSISFMEYMDEDQLREIQNTRNAILDRIAQTTSFPSEMDRFNFEHWLAWARSERSLPIRRHHVTALHYLTAADLATWFDLLLKCIPRLTAGIESEPRWLLRRSAQ